MRGSIYINWKNLKKYRIIIVNITLGDDNMKTILKSTKLGIALTAILSIIFGIVLLLYPQMTTNAICYALGVVLVICAVFHIFLYFKFKNKNHLGTLNLLVAIITGVLGIWVISNPKTVIQMIPIIFGVILIIEGIVDIKQSFELKNLFYENWWIAIMLALINMGFAALIVMEPFQNAKAIAIINGISFIYNGISCIWILLRLNKASKEIKKSLNTINKAYIDEKL